MESRKGHVRTFFRLGWGGLLILGLLLALIGYRHAHPLPETPPVLLPTSSSPTLEVPPQTVTLNLSAPLATASPHLLPSNTRAKECVRVRHWPHPFLSVPTATPTPTPTASPTPMWLPTPDGVHRTARVPIIMYHHIDAPPSKADKIRYNLTLSPELFEDHLRMLQAEGYTVITLDDLLLYLTRGRPLPPKPVILTFDDGYRDHYTQAFPLLRKYGMTGTFFIITDLVNQQHTEYLTWDMAREMRKAGMRFGAHGRTHIDLSQADLAQLVWQALGSTEVFQVELGEPARYIAYPSGRYNQQVIDVYRSAHYWAGLTTHQGVIQDSEHLFELKRLRVYPTTTGQQLKYLLEMDWDE